MRSVLLPFVLLMLSFSARSQNHLSDSRHSSRFTYVYKINANETYQLASSDMSRAGEKFLHSLVDSFDATAPTLSPGNYLFVHVRENKLVFDLKTIGDLQYDLINNSHDLVVSVHTASGKTIPDA